MKKVFLLLSFSLLIHFSLFAQLTPEEEELLYEERMISEQADRQSYIDGYRDECDIGLNVSVSVVFFEGYGEVQLLTDYSGEFEIIDGNEKVVSSLNLAKQIPSYLKLPMGSQYKLLGIDNCGNEFVAAAINVIERDVNKPLEVNPNQYEVIRDWQTSYGREFQDVVLSATNISDFDKTFLLQQIMYQGEVFKDGQDFHPLKKENLSNADYKILTCVCTEVSVSHSYLLAPIDRIRSDGRISGVYGSRSETRQSDKISLFRAWAFEGPSRYTELAGNTRSKKCAKIDEQWGWNTDENNEIIQIDMDAGGTPQISPNMEATMEFNMVCIDGDGNREDNCRCSREISFEFDYQSIVRAQAEVVRGGLFCGAERQAVAGAVDFMTVIAQEIGNPESIRMVASLLNGQTAQCNQTYNGPTFDEVLEFVVDAIDLSEDFDDEEARESVIGGVREIFSENWLQTEGCRNDLEGRIRSLPVNNRGTTMTLYQNVPVRITLAAGGSLIVGGQRKWVANARIHSSFSLSGIMIGQKDTEPTRNCCTPYVGSWMTSDIASDLPGGTGERELRSRIRAHFARNTIDQNVWSTTGDFIDYQRIDCSDIDVRVIIVTPGLQDDEEITIGRNSSGIFVNTPSISSEQQVELTLFDASGRKVSAQVLQYPTTVMPSTTTLPRGMYFLRLSEKGRLIKTLKAVL